MTDEGASVNESLMAACRVDNEELVQEILENNDFDIGYTDGAGNTFAHIAAKYGSLGSLECLVNLDDIDVNLKNHMEQNTPLHYAVAFQDKDVEVATCMVDILLQAGADTKIENRNKLTASMMVHPKSKGISDLLAQSSAVYQVDDDDIANDDEYGSDDDEPSD